MPEATPRFVACSRYRWEVALRETVIVGLVGDGGLGRLLAQQLSALDYAAALVIVIALVAPVSCGGYGERLRPAEPALSWTAIAGARPPSSWRGCTRDASSASSVCR